MIEGYRDVEEKVALLARPPRAFLRVDGRSPTLMLNGLLSGSMPPDLTPRGPERWSGRAPYSAMLTPKGRLVTDLRAARLANGEEGAILLDLPEAGLSGGSAHLRKYLPPRFAAVSELGLPAGMITLVGPRASEILSSQDLGLGLERSELDTANEGDEWITDDGSELGLRVLRTNDVFPAAFDVLGAHEALEALKARLTQSGVPERGDGLWEVLRLEHGRPRFGVELDGDTMPAEAGIEGRCIDRTKGCYTGQEVVVRVRDRGHVNRRLRGILLGDQPPPELGTSLFLSDRDRPVGAIRSYAQSPKFGQGISLAYLRREVEPPATVFVGAQGGPEGGVRSLSDDGWLLVEGDPSLYP